MAMAVAYSCLFSYNTEYIRTEISQAYQLKKAAKEALN